MGIIRHMTVQVKPAIHTYLAEAPLYTVVWPQPAPMIHRLRATRTQVGFHRCIRSLVAPRDVPFCMHTALVFRPVVVGSKFSCCPGLVGVLVGVLNTYFTSYLVRHEAVKTNLS